MKSRIAWLVPHPLKGSGGHRTIFSHIQNLAQRGHDCHVYIGREDIGEMSIDVLRNTIAEYYGVLLDDIFSGYEVYEKYDMSIATAWWTSEIVAKNVDATHKVYFVQDFEPWFNPMGDFYINAENSYKYGLTSITIGRWLSYLLRERYENVANYFEFTADLNVYFPLENVEREKAVCFVYQPEKPRRCPQIGKDALAIVKNEIPEVKIYTYGSINPPEFQFDYNHLGVLNLKDCNRLYNRCSVGLCLSSSNPSRVPFEMMATGLPTVEFYGENTMYDMPDGGVLLAERNPSSVAGAIIEILQSRELQKSMSTIGISHMKKRPAALEFTQCADFIEQVLDNRLTPMKNILPLYKKRAYFSDPPLPLAPPPSIDACLEPPPERDTVGIIRRLKDNRIGRVLKVLWKGYY